MFVIAALLPPFVVALWQTVGFAVVAVAVVAAFDIVVVHCSALVWPAAVAKVQSAPLAASLLCFPLSPLPSDSSPLHTFLLATQMYRQTSSSFFHFPFFTLSCPSSALFLVSPYLSIVLSLISSA